MKTIKILVPAFAFVFAIVGAFASNNKAALTKTAEYYKTGSTCVQYDTPCGAGATACSFTHPELGTVEGWYSTSTPPTPCEFRDVMLP